MSAALTVTVVGVLVAIIAVALAGANTRYHRGADALITAIDSLLPQTQCAQCGYPGCLPYAGAVANGAALDLCTPGGAETQAALANLLGRTAGNTLETSAAVRAFIDEEQCIGCYLCVEACPVDAIVGAPQWLHTVIEDRCTGCELCVSPCPVDCISLLACEEIPHDSAVSVNSEEAACIRCGRCRDACPVGLEPDLLWWASRDALPEQAREIGLDICIECGLCNPVCPSGIDLVGVFSTARSALADEAARTNQARRARDLFEERNSRLAREQLIASEARRERLSRGPRAW